MSLNSPYFLSVTWELAEALAHEMSIHADTLERTMDEKIPGETHQECQVRHLLRRECMEKARRDYPSAVDRLEKAKQSYLSLIRT